MDSVNQRMVAQDGYRKQRSSFLNEILPPGNPGVAVRRHGNRLNQRCIGKPRQRVRGAVTCKIRLKSPASVGFCTSKSRSYYNLSFFFVLSFLFHPVLYILERDKRLHFSKKTDSIRADCKNMIAPCGKGGFCGS